MDTLGREEQELIQNDSILRALRKLIALKPVGNCVLEVETDGDPKYRIRLVPLTSNPEGK